MIFQTQQKEFLGRHSLLCIRVVLLWTVILLLFGNISIWGQEISKPIPVIADSLAQDNSTENTSLDTSDTGLQIRLLAGKKAGMKEQNVWIYTLRYQQLPALVAAFLYFIQQGSYQNIQYYSPHLAVYGNSFVSLPDPSGIHSLPNFRSASHPQAGLAFWRNGSVLRSDILALSIAETGSKDQQNLVFFADLLSEPNKRHRNLSAKYGLRFVAVEALSSAARNYLDSLPQNRDAYQMRLEQDWQNYIEVNWPEVSTLLEEDWQRNEFGYYYRPIIEGQRALPKIGEDLNITLEQLDFAGLGAQTLPVIVAFGKDTLPMPFPYFVSRTPKGSQVEVLSPPSAVRSYLSKLGAETGGTRYQSLQDSFASKSWVYLRFALELP